MSIPKGKLIPIGGNEAKEPKKDKKLKPSKFFKSEILQEVLSELAGNRRIEIIPAASNIPGIMANMYLEAFSSFGCNNVGVLFIDSREDADKEEILQRVSRANGIMFTGGDQVRLMEKLHNTHLLELIKKKYENEDFVIAGTSAGAMAMSAHMVEEGYSNHNVTKGMVNMGEGLSLFPHGIFDTHFLKRYRLGRLTEALVKFKDCVAFGMSEDTAMVISNGNEMKAIGSGVIIILEGDNHGINNYKDALDQEPVFVENLRMHVLAKGATYLLKERKLIASKSCGLFRQ